MPLCITSNTLLVSERKLTSEDRSLAEGLSWTLDERQDSLHNMMEGVGDPASLEARYRQDREVVGQLRDGLSILERSDSAAKSVVQIVLKMRELAIHA